MHYSNKYTNILSATNFQTIDSLIVLKWELLVVAPWHVQPRSTMTIQLKLKIYQQ